MTRIAIVGGGIAGLSLAHALKARLRRTGGVGPTVLESAPRAGGNLRTERVEGYLCEWGPNGFLDNAPETLALVRELDLEPRMQVSDDKARRRFLYRRGTLHELPGGPAAFLRSGLLSWRGKLRLACEPLAGGPPATDETIHAFASRRIGREAADVLIDAMVSGIFAGDARRLSLAACFPKMQQMEREHGSLVRALIARRRQRRTPAGPVGAPAGRLTSFAGGVQDLIDGLTRVLGPQVRTGAEVVAVSPTNGGPPYQLTMAGDSRLVADVVVLAGGASRSARLVDAWDADLAAGLDAIRSAPLAVVCLGFDAATLEHPLDGFGFLVPRGEGPRILGALWDSSIYPGRAPAGRALIRVMVGGATDPEAVGLDDEALIELVRAELRTIMGVRSAPAMTRVFRHRLGIPQYEVGHPDRLARIEARLAHHPGLHVAGNAYRGVAINSCIAESGPLADRILRETHAAGHTRHPVGSTA